MWNVFSFCPECAGLEDVELNVRRLRIDTCTSREPAHVGMPDQWNRRNESSGRATAAGAPQTGMGWPEPWMAVGLASLSKTCQASVPAFFHAVPSVHASRISPRLLTAMVGCLRAVGFPEGWVGFEGVVVS